MRIIMARCVYCDKDESEFLMETPPDYFTDEHVIPQAVGGNVIQRNPFLLTKVCSWCNSLCGRYVDGRFVRSWFTQMARAGVAWRYVDLAQQPAVPLAFLGTTDLTAPDGRQCDAWLGPASDLIYHFHHPYPAEPDHPGLIGRPIHRPLGAVDPGYVFLFIGATNPAWHGTIVHSVTDEFDGADLYLANANPPHPAPFVPIPDERAALLPQLRVLGSAQHHIPVDSHYADRFLAKVALGMGTLYLAPDFVMSADAGLLRSFLFQKDDKKRENIPVAGSGSFGNTDELVRLLSWEDGHVVMLKRFGADVMLGLILFGRTAYVIRVSANLLHWPASAPADGMVFIIAPGLQRAVGPIHYSAYLAWKHSPDQRKEIGLQALDDLKARMEEVAAAMPPRHLQQP